MAERYDLDQDIIFLVSLSVFKSGVSYQVSEAVECPQGEVKGEPSDEGKDTVKCPRGPATTPEYRQWHCFAATFKITEETFLSETCDTSSLLSGFKSTIQVFEQQHPLQLHKIKEKFKLMTLCNSI